MVSPSPCRVHRRGNQPDDRLHQRLWGNFAQIACTATSNSYHTSMCGVLPMNDLLAAQALLANAMMMDPRLALANAVAWLDPSHILTHQVGVKDEEFDGDEVTLAFHLCRQLFPEVYADAMQSVWQGADEPILDRILLDGINSHLIMQLSDLEEIPGGIPVEMLGVSFFEDDFFQNYPHVTDILADLGIQP